MNRPDRDFRVLSLAGGGYLGVYTACVLAELEEWAGEPLARRFDLIAGTSVGGILAVALAFEVPMAKVVDLFMQQGNRIFSSRAAPTTRIGKLIDLSRSVMGPKYSGAPLRKALTEHLGKRTLGSALHKLAIPAVDVSRSHTKIFKTPHAPDSRGDQRIAAVDVAMATSAAPGYFPAVRIGETLYADGGLFAVAPDQVAMHEAEHFLNIDPQNLSMLSIGTATAGYQPDDGVAADDGAVGWLSDGRLILTLVSVQQQHVQSMMEQRLGARYLRVDAPWPRGENLGIDVATPQAAESLCQLAQDSLANADLKRLDRMFGLAPRPDAQGS